MFKRFQKDITQYYAYSIASARSKLKSEVANSYLNWIWWILEPLCFMLIYTFVFGYVFNAREQYFPVYIFIGLTMWNFFNKTVQENVRIVKKNKAVVSKVYFPKYILILTTIWVNSFKMLISFGLVVVLMIAYQVPVTLNVLFAIPVLLTLVLFTFGCACFMLHFGVYVEDLSHAISIIMKVMFYLTGVFYDLSKRIPQIGTALNEYNPVAFLLTAMREGLIYGTTPNLILMLIWFAVSILLVMAGIRKIYKEENSYIRSI